MRFIGCCEVSQKAKFGRLHKRLNFETSDTASLTHQHLSPSMQRIAESEMILNGRGAIYHLDLLPEELAETIITVGDPDRVEQVSRRFDKVELARQHREFVTHTGLLGGRRISVVSTGIGTDNIDIVLNELDALVNIDLNTRLPKENLTALNIIRLGTTGSLQGDVAVDELVASTHGIGIDNLLNFYRFDQTVEEKALLQNFITYTGLQATVAQPYISAGSMHLLKHFVQDFHQGLTVTCPGFYGPQGRVLRLGLRQPDLVDALTRFQFGQHRITNFEMETAGIYGLGRLLGHHCLSLSVIVANRITKTFSKDGTAAVDNLIDKALTVISEL
jgi:uridine phosphorylase